MRKSTKWFVYGIAILIIAAAILFVWVYPQLDRSAQQTIRDIQTGALADDTQTESPTVDDHTEADNGGVPTAAPEALAVGLRGVGETIHDTETMGEGSRDYTLNRVEVYDTIEDSPISLSECVPNTSYDTYQTWKFILLDMNVTNTSESEMEPARVKNTNLCLTSSREMRVIHKCFISVHTLTAQIALPTTTSSIWPLVIL